MQALAVEVPLCFTFVSRRQYVGSPSFTSAVRGDARFAATTGDIIFREKKYDTIETRYQEGDAPVYTLLAQQEATSSLGICVWLLLHRRCGMCCG